MKRRSTIANAAVAGLAVAALTLAGCSSSGGKQETGLGAEGEEFTIAMVTHAPAGDTFFDIIRKGADAAAAANNVTYEYSSDGDAGKQAVLLENAINRKVDAIAVAIPNPGALNPVIKEAVAAGIPVVAFNAGLDAWQDAGALMYFGQDESLAGDAAGKRLGDEGAKKILCVLQAQGQVQLEARCDGVKKGFSGTTDKLYVDGTDMASVQSRIQSKLQQDSGIDRVITLGAPVALGAVQSIEGAGSSAKLVTFDTNPELVKAIESQDVQWAVDQQPFLQGYHSIESLALYLRNGNILGGGNAVLTGPSFIDQDNIAEVADFAAKGTR